MSASLGYELHARNPKDFKEMAEYATELTREWSLKELGYDMTNPDENPEKEFQSFCIMSSGNVICWDDFTGCRKGIPIKEIVDRISKHFPEMKFIYRAFGEGPLAYECIIKNGVKKEIKPYGLCVYIENGEDFRCLADMVQQEGLKAPYFIEEVIVKEDQCIALLYFDSLTQEDSEWALNDIMDEITKLLPYSNFYAIFFNNNEIYDLILRKAHVINGKTEWQEAPKIDGESPTYEDYSGQDYENHIPFFKGVNAEIFMSIMENHPAPIVKNDIEDMESFPNAESSESDDLPR